MDTLGPGVAGPVPGDHVAYAGPTAGAYAEAAAVAATSLMPVPDGVDGETAAGVLLQGMTAFVLTDRVHRAATGPSSMRRPVAWAR